MDVTVVATRGLVFIMYALVFVHAVVVLHKMTGNWTRKATSGHYRFDFWVLGCVLYAFVGGAVRCCVDCEYDCDVVKGRACGGCCGVVDYYFVFEYGAQAVRSCCRKGGGF